MKVTKRQLRRLIKEWFSDEHDPVTGERDQYEPDDQMQQVQDEIYDLASREVGVGLDELEDMFGGMGIDAAMQAEQNGRIFMEDEVFYASGSHMLSPGPQSTRSYMGESKAIKRQLKRIIKEAMSEELATAHDQISEDVEEMGYAFAVHDTAELWVDDNARFYHGIFIDTRPQNDGSGVTKVKIEWPEWDYADLG